MSLVSATFLLFLVASLFCYFISPRGVRWIVLLAASYVFYWIVGGFFALGAISFTIATVYFCSLWASSLRKQREKRTKRRLPLAICLILNFGALLLFKYSGVILPKIGILLIPGISFYTFQAAGYLTDVYRGKAEPEKNPLKLALFLSFFPQLIQGPISRHSEIAADLFAGHGWDWDRSRNGVQRIIWGYFMKLIVADRAAVIVDKVFSGYENYGGATIIIVLLVYSVQIYADFAGGINVTLGIGEILGIKMPENFKQPFFANSLADFWRRWHITLSSWLKDYLFYPIALSKLMGRLRKLTRKMFGARIGKLLPACVATFCVYIVMGIWHGSGKSVFVFGFLNGFIISASLLMAPFIDKLRAKTKLDGGAKGFGHAFAITRTLVILVILRYFARADALRGALAMLKWTVLHPQLRELWDGTIFNLGLGATDYIVLALGFIAILACDYVAERGKDWRDAINGTRPIVQFSVLLVALASITAFGIFSSSALSATFIYAQY
ncbi:MAG: MBOAT family protein [Oscillospiraceae bacterium]|nr:MBOAT family protein [Oscillospiraceae bacterium]